jgi:hypothetical protein
MRLSTVIVHFYQERMYNLQVIVDSLLAGTVVPEEIIIWNNGPERLPLVIKGGPVIIESSRNLGAQARFIAALAARGERVLFLDNDIAVRETTVDNLLYWSGQLGGVVTLEGRKRVGDTYSKWPKLYGHGLSHPEKVFLSLGRGELVSQVVLQRVLSTFPFGEKTVMDDLAFSACCERHGVPIVVVPCVKGHSDLADLPMGGVGLCKTPGFNEERTRVAYEIASDPEVLKSQAESA